MFEPRYESPSSIMKFVDCPYAYHLKYHEKLKEVHKDDTPLRAGKSDHAILEHFYKDLNLQTQDPDLDFVEKMKREAQQYWDRTISQKVREEHNAALFLWLKFEIQRFKRYQKDGILDKFLPLSTEQDISDHEKKLRCIVDKRCMSATGATYALDYKSDKKFPTLKNFSGKLEDIDMKYKVQAGMNAMVLKSLDQPINNFYFQFLRFPDKLLSVPLTPTLFSEIETIINQIRKSEEFSKKDKGCFMCGLKIHCQGKQKSIHCLTQENLMI